MARVSLLTFKYCFNIFRRDIIIPHNLFEQSFFLCAFHILYIVVVKYSYYYKNKGDICLSAKELKELNLHQRTISHNIIFTTECADFID